MNLDRAAPLHLILEKLLYLLDLIVKSNQILYLRKCSRRSLLRLNGWVNGKTAEIRMRPEIRQKIFL